MRGGRMAASVVLLAVVTACGDSRTVHYSIQVPAGRSGWVAVAYGVTGAPPLARRDGRLVLTVPAAGPLVTSSAPPGDGVSLDLRYARVGSDGATHPIHDADRDADAPGDETRRHFGALVACCTVTGTTDTPPRSFFAFYVGHGPAGDPPQWPTIR